MFFRKFLRTANTSSPSLPPEKRLVQSVIEWIASDAQKLARLEKAYNVQGAQAVLQAPKLAQTIGLMESLVRHWLQGDSQKELATHLASMHQQHDVHLAWFLDAVRVLRQEATKMGAPEAFFEASAAFSNAVAAAYEVAFRQQEKALEDRARRLSSWQSITEYATEALFVADPAYGTILWANEALAALLGGDPKELIGKSWQAMTDHASIDLEALRAKRQVVRRETMVSSQQGAAIPARISLRLIPGDAFDRSEVLLGSLVNLREEKAKASALAMQEAYWRAIFEGCSEGLAIFNEDGYFLDVNPAFCQILGYDHDEILRLGWEGITPKEHIPYDRQMIAKVKNMGEVVRYEKPHIYKDGHVANALVSFRKLPAQNGADKTLFLKTMTDISQLEAYRELEEMEQYWRAIFDSSSEAMAVFTPDGRHLDVNPAWERLTGYSKEEALSAAFSVENILDAETAATLKKALNQSDQATLEQTVHAKDGQDRIIKASIQRLPMQKNSQPSYILVAADITTLKAREAELSQIISYTEHLLENLATGNLTADDTPDLMGAARRIQMRYNTTIAALDDLVGKIRHIGEQLKHASHELASGQQEIAQRIDQEAASLEEIAASLEEITTSAGETSKNAQASTDLAQKIAQEAEDGQVGMEKLLALMESIYAQAQQTTRILSTIAEVAFQTNILSLNASVEAARAGVDGRGFSVIAAEIRNLANKVSAETRQIDSWLKSLVGETRLGKEAIADSTAKSQAIANGARAVANRMNAIAEAAMETDKSIHQIQETIAVLDQGVQQSATMVEEVSTAADTLLQQAEDMSSTLGAFSSDTKLRSPGLPAEQKRAPERLLRQPHLPKAGKTPRPDSKNPAVPKADNEWEEF